MKKGIIKGKHWSQTTKGSNGKRVSVGGHNWAVKINKKRRQKK